MPHYLFEIHDGGITPDDLGLDLPDLDAAVREATKALPAIAADCILRSDDHCQMAVVVRDESGRPVYTAALSFFGTRL